MRQHKATVEKYGEETFEATLNTGAGRKLFDLMEALRKGDISLVISKNKIRAFMN